MDPKRSGDVAFQPLVDGLDCPASVVDAGYHVLAANLQYRTAYVGGGLVEGRRCYSVSHHRDRPCSQCGEVCPLERASTARTQIRALHIHRTADGQEHEDVTVVPLIDSNGGITAFVERFRPVTAASATARPGKLVGRSAPFTRMLELVTRGAPSRSTVLLLGESGTGKERVARVLHALSDRASAPFVSVDCSGLTESLFESELFGHERGSFTGAFARKRGLVEAAHGGTLFLDEVGDVPLGEQVKLLRLLETGVFRRVGGVDELHSDFRLLCATNRDLGQMVASGAFRRDLYFRISAFPIHLPPLRDRKDDIPVLVELFLTMAAASGPVKRISPEALTVLEAYEFPGNVRELHNLIERACLLADGDELLPEHFPGVRPAIAPVMALPRPPGHLSAVVPLMQAERDYVESVAARFQGSRSELAGVLGLSPRTLYRMLHSIRTSPAWSPAPRQVVCDGARAVGFTRHREGGPRRTMPGVN
jgi:DNA-binding NtrC family response regulator